MARHATQFLAIATLVGSAAFASMLTIFPAVAYNDYGSLPCPFSYAGGSNFLYVPYQNDPYNPPFDTSGGDAYASAFATSRSAWAGSVTPILFSVSSGHYLSVYFARANGYDGQTTFYCSGGIRSTTAVYLNRTYLDGSSTFHKSKIGSHELGHHIGLRHSYATAIMGYNPGTFNYPQADDECGVNHIYTSTSSPPLCGY